MLNFKHVLQSLSNGSMVSKRTLFPNGEIKNQKIAIWSTVSWQPKFSIINVRTIFGPIPGHPE